MNIILPCLILIITSILLVSNVASKAEITKTITVHGKGNGDFRYVQEAIDSIPAGNKQWIKIKIKAGIYMEKVRIPKEKGYLMLEGDGAKMTVISWSGHDANISRYDRGPNRYKVTADQDSATFAVWAKNVVLKDLGFKNNYGRGLFKGKAVAVTLAADKIAVYGCSFIGIQDTLCDAYDRHYFKNCYIEGAVDFIWGFGQSLYENCNIQTVAAGRQSVGWVTAHGRYKEDSTGFVFKDCIVDGTTQTYLGRAWQPLARVIFFRTYMSSIVVPQGWDNNKFDGQLTTIVEKANSGPGSSLRGRVNWMKRLSTSQLYHYVAKSFVDDGWISQQPM